MRHEIAPSLGVGAGEAGEDDDEVNVKVIFEKRTVLDFDVFIPIMTNTRKIEAGEEPPVH